METKFVSYPQSGLELGPSHCLNGNLGQDLGFGGFAFALKLPEWRNTNLLTVRPRQTSFPNGSPNLVPNKAMNLGAQLGPMSITKLSPNWVAKRAPFISLSFCCLGGRPCLGF